MPDPIRCSVDTSQAHHTVNCEVDIGPEPSVAAPSSAQPSGTKAAAPPAAAAPASPPPALTPAVAALVDRSILSRHWVKAAPVDKVTVDSATACAGALLAVPLLGVKVPPLAILAGLKVGYDLGACLGKNRTARQDTADQAVQVKECESDGGIPSGFVGSALMCFEPSAVTQ